MGVISKQKINSIDSSAPMASSTFSKMLFEHLDRYYNEYYDELLIVCIGTDRSTGDCLGPLTGYKLFNFLKKYDDIHVMGTLDQPVHAKNLKEKIEEIKQNYKNPFIIAVDACLGNLERVGHVSINMGPLKPGAGVNKSLPSIGDIHVTGVVNLGGFMEYVILQNTRLNIVMRMAEVISTSFNTAIWQLNKRNLLKN